MREILTLQLGNLSNYVGTHFWNTQESYFTYSDKEASLVDHNIHWRQGIAADGSDTFLPRTVIYDLKGGFGPLRKTNALYEAGDDARDSSLWSGPSTVQKQPELTPSPYQQSLDAGTKPAQLTSSEVRYWSDFSRVYFHPKSLVQLYDYELSSTIRPFERFSMGSELFHELDREHDIVDRDWRPFVEECDRMQGIQIYSTVDDAWGGFAASYLEVLRDEYPKSCIWMWALQTPVLDAPRDKRQLRLANIAHSVHESFPQASMVMPLSIPEANMPSNLNLDLRSPWQVSALFATAAESASLPSRLSSGANFKSTSLSDMTDTLNSTGNRRLAATRMAVAPNANDLNNGRLDIDLSSLGRSQPIGNTDSERVYSRVESQRGPLDPAVDTEESRSALPIRSLVGEPVMQSYSTNLKFPLLDSYPGSIFTNAQGQESLDIRTALSMDKSITAKIRDLLSQTTWSMGVDEREDLANGLAEIADAYQDDWSSGSDDDDDDM